MNILLTAVLAATAGLSWNWATDNQPMSYWLMAAFLIGSCLGADLLELAWLRFHVSRRAQRRVHARPTARKEP